MVVAFSKSPIDRLYCWICNKYECKILIDNTLELGEVHIG